MSGVDRVGNWDKFAKVVHDYIDSFTLCAELFALCR